MKQQAMIEAVEPRILFSNYQFISLANFVAATKGSGPSALVMDSSGNFLGTTQSGGAGNQGTVFQIAKGSSTITTLASYDDNSGLYPDSPITIDSSGNLLGTTFGEGLDGTVFEIAKGTRKFTTLASFNGTNGIAPTGITLDSSGNLFGTTESGGKDELGTVFEITKGSTKITTVVSFNGTNGANPQAEMTLDSKGDLLGTTSTGGDANNDGTVFEIARGSRTITTLAKFNGADGTDPVAGIIIDPNGNFLGTTAGDSQFTGGSKGTVFEIAKGSRTITALAAFNGTDGVEPLGNITLDSNGNLLGTTSNGPFGHAQSTVFEIAKGSRTITTLVTFNGANGSFAESGLALNSNGDLFGTTTGGGIVSAGTAGSGTVFELIPVKKSSTPYFGHPVAFGLIQAENFDLGGQNVAYYNPENVNKGGVYRPNEGVGIAANPAADGGGYIVGYTEAGEWLDYTVSVAATGTYTLNFRVASGVVGGAFQLNVDGVDVTGKLAIPDKGWNTFQTIARTGVHLTAGTHVLRLMIDSTLTGTGNGNFDWFEAIKTG